MKKRVKLPIEIAREQALREWSKEKIRRRYRDWAIIAFSLCLMFLVFTMIATRVDSDLPKVYVAPSSAIEQPNTETVFYFVEVYPDDSVEVNNYPMEKLSKSRIPAQYIAFSSLTVIFLIVLLVLVNVIADRRMEFVDSKLQAWADKRQHDG